MAAATSAILLSPSLSSSPIASRNVRRSVDSSVHKVILASARRPVQQSCLLGERLALTIPAELEATKRRNICTRVAADDDARTSAGSLPAAALTSLISTPSRRARFQRAAHSQEGPAQEKQFWPELWLERQDRLSPFAQLSNLWSHPLDWGHDESSTTLRRSREEDEDEEWLFDPLQLRLLRQPNKKRMWKSFFESSRRKTQLAATGRGQAAAIEDGTFGPGDFFKGKLPGKYLTLLGLLALSRLGVYIPLWGIDRAAFSSSLDENTLLSTLDTLSGGGVGRIGLFSLGIVPYINAQIVFQLLGVLYPKIQEIQKEGEAGRNKIQRWTKFAAIGFGLAQAVGQVYFFKPYAYDFSPTWQLSAILGLTLGSLAVIQIGDKITDLKLGNGTSLLIFTNIVSYLPATFGRTVNQAAENANYGGLGLLLGSFIFLVFGIVYVQEAERKIPINYAQRYTVQMNKNAYLPFKVNSTGVMPIIFASSLLAAPASLGRFTNADAFKSLAVALDPSGPAYLLVYIAFIAFFNYYYTFLQLDPVNVSDQLKRQGASIPMVRPGKATAAYITDVLSKISVLGSGFLAGMATAPSIVEAITQLQAFRGFAGTSVLILVGCATDSARKAVAEVISNKYKDIDLPVDVDRNRLPPPR